MKLISLKKNNNVFITFLKSLKVKYTDEYAKKLYNEHPHKYNLFGLSRMLSHYNIENSGIKINDKNGTIYELEVPFIAHIGSDFVVVSKITDERVHYIWNSKELNVPIDEFCKIWSGIVLYAEPNKNSIEPNYKTHNKKEIFNLAQKASLLIAVLFILIITSIKNGLYKDIEFYLLATANLAGVYTGYQLIMKQLNIHSTYADKICSLFSKSDCNNVLESKAAKLGDIIGWSEIGFGYFITNTLIVFCFPFLLPYMAMVNILSLPYTLWSIWFQKFKAKQWCPLCLIVQSLLWIIFFINWKFGMIYIQEINIIDVIITGLLYLIPILSINLLVPLISHTIKMERVTQELNSIKADENVLSAILKKQPYYEVTKETSSILWGNTDSTTLVTILTNPHCAPCAKMHKRVENILKETNKLCIQYVFSSFGKELDTSNKFLTAIYLYKEEPIRKTIFDDWFEKGKNSKDQFFEKYSVDLINEIVTNEFEKHQAWIDATGLRATPTILVNGHILPDNYKIEDLKYL